MSQRNSELEKLLSEAYEVAPSKGKFFDELGSVAGVLMGHQSSQYCEGFIRAMELMGHYDQSFIWFRGVNDSLNRGFVVKNESLQTFQEAIEKVKNRELVSKPTPRKVLTRMVATRMENILAHIKDHNARMDEARRNKSHYAEKSFPVPVFSTKEALSAWSKLPSNMRPGIYRRDKDLDKVCDILSRDDIPDDIYEDAWNLTQVKEVMES